MGLCREQETFLYESYAPLPFPKVHNQLMTSRILHVRVPVSPVTYYTITFSECGEHVKIACAAVLECENYSCWLLLIRVFSS